MVFLQFDFLRCGVVRHGPLVSLCRRLHLNLVTIVFYSHRVSPHNFYSHWVSPHNSQPHSVSPAFLSPFNLHTLFITHNSVCYPIPSLVLLCLLYVSLIWHQSIELAIPAHSSFFLKLNGSFLLFIFSSQFRNCSRTSAGKVSCKCVWIRFPLRLFHV